MTPPTGDQRGLSQVERDWLDERFGRINDALRDVRADINEIKQAEKAKRLAVYGALATGIVAVVSALVTVAVSLPGGGV